MARHARSLALRVALEVLAATAASSVALTLMAKSERRGAFQPLNATSHWLNGEKVAGESALGWRTTGVGMATHLAATAFWAVIYEGWVRRGGRAATDVIGKAAAMAGISALVDYRATPKRFTPGWELVLTPAAMVTAYFALAAGLAAGGLIRRRLACHSPRPLTSWGLQRTRSGSPLRSGVRASQHIRRGLPDLGQT